MVAIPAAGPAAGGGVWHAPSQGRIAEAQFSYEAGGGVVNVFQNGSSTFLLFAIWGNDPSSALCTMLPDEFGCIITFCTHTRSLYDYGWGEIPSAQMQFTDPTAHLLTTTGPGFTHTRCTTDKSTPTPTTTCAPGPARSFDLTWEQNELYDTRTAGLTRRDFGSFVYKSLGSSRTRSAFTDGTIVLGASTRQLTDAPGGVGHRSGEVTITATP